MEWNNTKTNTGTCLYILSLHHTDKIIPCYIKPDVCVFPFKEQEVLFDHTCTMNQHSVDFISQAGTRKTFSTMKISKYLYIINMVKTNQNLSACWVYYHAQVLDWVGGCFREKRHHVSGSYPHRTRHMQAEQGESWQKQPSLSKLLHQSNTDWSALWRWCTALS